MLKALTPKLPILWAALALLCLAGSALPRQYVATARVLLPPQVLAPYGSRVGSRVRELRYVSVDAAEAASRVREMLAVFEHGVVLDETSVRARPAPAWLLFPGLLFTWLLLRVRAGRKLLVPERALVREAVMLAQRGHPAVLVETGGRFRVVLAHNAPDRASLPVLAKLPSGASVLARRA